jgi:hypothetical protein
VVFGVLSGFVGIAVGEGIHPIVTLEKLLLIMIGNLVKSG